MFLGPESWCMKLAMQWGLETEETLIPMILNTLAIIPR